MIKHFGRDSYRTRGWTIAFYWCRRDLSKRLEGESYWRGEFVLTIELPRRLDLYRLANPYRYPAQAWTGRPREICFDPGYLSIKIRSPGGFKSYWSIGR